MNILEPCPFCGGEAGFERYGDRRQSSIVTCTNCGARVEANEEGDFNGTAWNRRKLPAPEPLSQPSQQDLETQIRSIQKRAEKLQWGPRVMVLASLALVFFSAVQTGLWIWLVYLRR